MTKSPISITLKYIKEKRSLNILNSRLKIIHFWFSRYNY